jgi:hypothetical protein
MVGEIMGFEDNGHPAFAELSIDEKPPAFQGIPNPRRGESGQRPALSMERLGLVWFGSDSSLKRFSQTPG